MSEKLIHCPACLSENLDNSVYCCQCGSPMRKGIPVRIRRSQWAAILLIALFLSLTMTAAIQLFTPAGTGHPPAARQPNMAQGESSSLIADETDPGTDRREQVSPAGRLDPAEPETAGIDRLIVGTVSIISPDGFAVSRFPAAVVGGSWLALPSRACIGGNKWFFKAGDEKAIPIEGGLWGRGDAVGLWELAGEGEFAGPGFANWVQDNPVRLLSLETGQLSEPMTLTPSGVQGAFLFCALADSLEPGVFLQNGKVVGWSFGEVLDGAYMWIMGPDANLLYTNYVDDFYYETFAGGREEYFSIALTRGRSYSPQRQLQLFTEGFRLPPKLSPEDRPGYLRSKYVYPYILKLVDQLMDQEAYHYIAPLAEEPLLWETNDPELLADVAVATRNIYGMESALNFIEGPGTDIALAKDPGKSELRQLHLEFYLEWLNELLDDGDTVRGWQVYNRARSSFAGSPELHLIAVELALADGDWEQAEGLLYQREYPADLRDTRELLAGRIADLKGRENKIVIGFQPGSREVPVTATLNGQMEQPFVVDTGASFVTIPFSTVESLGIEDQMSGKRHEVRTAGGPVYARAVTLSSIELHGWPVSEVKTLVMDLPDRPGLGLLGLNFLNRFRMDLQADEGILTLEPK